MTHFSFFSKKCFFYWGTFFSALEQSREEHFFFSIAAEKLKRLTWAFFNLLIQSGDIDFLLQFFGFFFHMSPWDAHKNSTKQNLRKSSTSVVSFECFLSTKIILRATKGRRHAKNLPQLTLLFY